MDLFHLLNRGVDKRQIFLDNQDRARFVHDMYEFNDKPSAANTRRRISPAFAEGSTFDLRSRTSERVRIVDIHGWCIMGNHYHLLLSEIEEGGITTFIRKLNIRYAKYFNERYERDGALFQGRTKRICINSDAYFLHILHYIHLNPLDLLESCKGWRERRIIGAARALAHLEKYRWSSYLDYCGHKNFPSILTTDLFGGVFKDYKREVREYLNDLDIASIRPLILE